ncbi:MAG: hypothetical protein Q9160_008156 [Pyrenula sp. 1 TL-2023]
MSEDGEKKIKVLVTGFGAFHDIKVNPSYEIASRLPSSLNTINGTNVSLIIYPSPVPVAYNVVQTLVPRLLEEHRPDIVVHLGLDTGRDYFALEASAPRDGYHQVPDTTRKVFTKAEAKSLWGKLDEHLTTTVDREDVLQRMQASFARSHGTKKASAKKGGKKDGKVVTENDVRLSDDVGTYICGFIYYTSLAWFVQNSANRRPVVFFHVPTLPTGEDLDEATKITTVLIEALVESEMER